MKYKYLVTYKSFNNVAVQEFDNAEDAIEFFWSIRYKAYAIYKVDVLTNSLIEEVKT